MLFMRRGAAGGGWTNELGEERRDGADDTLRYLDAQAVGERRLAAAFADVVTVPEPPGVARRSHTGEEHDRCDVVVPVVFGVPGEPPREVVYRVVAAVLESVGPPFFHAACAVAHYEVQFAHTDAAGGRVVSRRVSLGAERAERSLVDGSLDPMALARVVAHEEDGEADTPVDWRRFDPCQPDLSEERAPIHEAAMAAAHGPVADCIRGRRG